jgi:hypothetical protein
MGTHLLYLDLLFNTPVEAEVEEDLQEEADHLEQALALAHQMVLVTLHKLTVGLVEEVRLMVEQGQPLMAVKAAAE